MDWNASGPYLKIGPKSWRCKRTNVERRLAAATVPTGDAHMENAWSEDEAAFAWTSADSQRCAVNLKELFSKPQVP